MTVIQQLESRAKRYRNDEAQFYLDFPVPPPEADDCTPMPVVVPPPAELMPTPYRPPPVPTPPPSPKKTPDKPKKSPESMRKKRTPPPGPSPPKERVETIRAELLERLKQWETIGNRNREQFEKLNAQHSILKQWPEKYFNLYSNVADALALPFDRSQIEKLINDANALLLGVKLLLTTDQFNEKMVEDYRNEIGNASVEELKPIQDRLELTIEIYFTTANALFDSEQYIAYNNAINALAPKVTKIPVWFLYGTADNTLMATAPKFDETVKKTISSRTPFYQSERDRIPKQPPFVDKIALLDYPFKDKEINFGIDSDAWSWADALPTLQNVPILTGYYYDQNKTKDQTAEIRKTFYDQDTINFWVFYMRMADGPEAKNYKWDTTAKEAEQEFSKWMKKLPPFEKLLQRSDFTLVIPEPAYTQLTENFKVVPSVSAYLHSFNTRMASLLKPLPPATLTVISSRQKVDLAARAEHDRPK